MLIHDITFHKKKIKKTRNKPLAVLGLKILRGAKADL